MPLLSDAVLKRGLADITSVKHGLKNIITGGAPPPPIYEENLVGYYTYDSLDAAGTTWSNNVEEGAALTAQAGSFEKGILSEGDWIVKSASGSWFSDGSVLPIDYPCTLAVVAHFPSGVEAWAVASSATQRRDVGRLSDDRPIITVPTVTGNASSAGPKAMVAAFTGNSTTARLRVDNTDYSGVTTNNGTPLGLDVGNAYTGDRTTTMDNGGWRAVLAFNGIAMSASELAEIETWLQDNFLT